MGPPRTEDNDVPVTLIVGEKYESCGRHPSGPKSRAFVRDSCVACWYELS